VAAAQAQTVGGLILAILYLIVVHILWPGYLILHPNEAQVLQ
jgi:hypothetical protein